MAGKHPSRKSEKNLLFLADLVIRLFQCFKAELGELRYKLSQIYLRQVRSSDEFDLFLTYLYLFRNKCAKYKLRTLLIFLMPHVWGRNELVVIDFDYAEGDFVYALLGKRG